MVALSRSEIFPEGSLPDAGAAIREGRALAASVSVGPSAFLEAQDVDSEFAFKHREAEQDRIMQHAQIGYRSLERSIEAAETIHREVTDAGYRVDRYGICLDWSMGYPQSERAGRPKGTGLILEDANAFRRLANAAPVAAHFGDFVIGMPSALENTAAALEAGATSIGNLGQYFTFELPGWPDDVGRTRATVAAIALAAAQPVPVLIHSNIDDGFAARFSDLASALGAVLLEIRIVDELIGGRVSHCYGHTFSRPLGRFAFQRALARVSRSPGTMVYGNTTAFGANEAANYAALGAYLTVDIQAQHLMASGHAVNPVPITEAERIPDIPEIVAAQIFCGELGRRSGGFEALVIPDEADRMADRLIDGATRFRDAVLRGFTEAGVDTENPLEMLLAMRRVGAKQLEQLFGAGGRDSAAPNGRRLVEPSPVLDEIATLADASIAAIDPARRAAIETARLRIVTATTDVHEYGKRLLDSVAVRLGIETVDGGISVDPGDIADAARGADAICLSTYNGVALDFMRSLMSELQARDLELPVLVGGKLNQVPPTSNTSLPVDVGDELTREGALVCRSITDLYGPLADLAAQKQAKAS